MNPLAQAPTMRPARISMCPGSAGMTTPISPTITITTETIQSRTVI